MQYARENLCAVDLCSGPGGVTTGFKSVGITVLAAVDTDPTSRETYAANHPEVLLLPDDLAVLDPATVLKKLSLRPGELDILTACTPCQTFSSLGVKHRKKEDPRNALVGRVVDFVEVILPRAVVMENVPQLMDDDRFQDVIVRLRELGFGVWYGRVNAADFGVPQRRRRLVLIALRHIPDHAIPHLISTHPLLAQYRIRRTVRWAFDQLSVCIPNDPLSIPRTHYPPVVARRIAAIPADGGSRASLPDNLQLTCHKKLDAAKTGGSGNVYGRMKWDDVAPTLTTRCVTPACGRFLHPEENRAITLREAAWLQTFPLTYAFKGGTMAVQAQIGNAVPPQLAKVIALIVQDALTCLEVSQAPGCNVDDRHLDRIVPLQREQNTRVSVIPRHGTMCTSAYVGTAAACEACE